MTKEIKLTAEQIEFALKEKLQELQYAANKARYQKRYAKLIKDMAKDNLKFYREDSGICVKDYKVYEAQLKGN